MLDKERDYKKVLDKIHLEITDISQKTGLDWKSAYARLKEIMQQENPFSRRYACHHCLKTIEDKLLRFSFPDGVNVYLSEKNLDELLSAGRKSV